MIELLANRLTNVLVKHDLVDESECERYVYGMQYLISISISFVVLLCIAMLTKTYLELALYMVGFMIMRSSVGGYHTDNYTTCLMMSIVIVLANIYFMKDSDMKILVLILMTVSNVLTVFLFSPIEHKNRPFSDNEYIRFKEQGRIKVIVLSLIGVFGFILLPTLDKFFISLTFGVFTSAVSLFVAYFVLERRES